VLDELVEAIATQSAERALGLVHRLIGGGTKISSTFAAEAIRHFRNLLVVRVCGASSDLVAAPSDEQDRLSEQSGEVQRRRPYAFFNILLATDDDLRKKPIHALHLEFGAAEAVNAQRLAPLEEILADCATQEAREISAIIFRRATACDVRSAVHLGTGLFCS